MSNPTTPPAGMRWRKIAFPFHGVSSFRGSVHHNGSFYVFTGHTGTEIEHDCLAKLLRAHGAVEMPDELLTQFLTLPANNLEPLPVERDDVWQQVRDLVEDTFGAGWAQHAGKQTRDYPGLDAIADRIVALFDAGVPAAVLTCHKVPHFGNGWLHDESDDSPYDVDGVLYCGRCHHRCGADGKCARATPEVQAVEVLVKAGWTTRLVRKVGSTSWHADENDNATKRVARYHDGEPYGYPVHRALIAPTREGA